MSTETFLSPDSLDQLKGLIGQEIVAYGTDLELDDGVGAFGAWLQCTQGWVSLEYVEEVVEFDSVDGNFENVESLLTVHPLTTTDPGGDPYELKGKIVEIIRIQDRVALIKKLENSVGWEWWRDSGLRFILDSGQELLIHCASPVVIEVKMQAGALGTLNPEVPGRIYQEGEKRRYEYSNREIRL